MNVIVFCDMPCEWLMPLQGIRAAELPLCGRPLLSYLLAIIAHSRTAEKVWLVDAPSALQKTAEQIGGITLMQGAPPQSAQEDTLVISALGLLDCDFNAALSFHQKSGCAITFLTLPSMGGMAVQRLRTEGNRVTGLGGRSAVYADTGYAIVRRGTAITPRLTALCDRVEAGFYAQAELWEPVSSVASYLRCQKAVLSGWLEIGAHKRLDGVITPSADSFPQVEFQPPVYLGHRVKIGADTKLAESVIGNGVTIGSGVSLDGCVVQDGAYIGDGVQARDALICADAMLMNGCRLEAGSAIGEGTSIGEHAVVETQVRVFAGKRVAPRTTAELDVRHNTAEALALEEERVVGMLTPVSAVRLGNCLAQAGDVIAVGYTAKQAAKTLALAVASGCAAAGARVILVPDTVLPALCYASMLTDTDLLLHIDTGAEVSLRLLSSGGLPLTEEQEDALERALYARTVSQVPHSVFGEITELSAAHSLYEFSLLHRFPAAGRSDVSVSTSDARLRRLGTRLFAGGAEHTGILLQLSADGRQLSVYSDKTGFIRPERVLLLCCQAVLSKEKEVALPEDAPRAAELIAQRTGGTILRDSMTQDGSKARETALRQRFTLDGLYAAGILLEYLSNNQLTLAAALEQIPRIHVARRILPAGAIPQRILRSFCGGDTLVREDARGVISFRPSRSGKSVAVYAEAATMEAASELCAEAERLFGK